MHQEENTKKLVAPVGVLREQLRGDARTIEIARALGVDLEEYIEQILHFASNPDEDPELRIINDKTLDQEGFDVPDQEELLEWFARAERGELDKKDELPNDGFGQTAEEAKRKTLEAAFAAAAKLKAPTIAEAKGEVVISESDPKGSVLKDQLLRRRMSNDLENRRAMVARRTKK